MGPWSTSAGDAAPSSARCSRRTRRCAHPLRPDPRVEGAVVGERCEIVGGSFFDAVPEGADAYLLKAVLHDWEDDDALRILARCRAAIPAHGALLVVERDLGAPNENADAKLSDLNMMVGVDGRERTRDEFAELLARGGFALQSAAPSAIGLSVFEAHPA